MGAGRDANAELTAFLATVSFNGAIGLVLLLYFGWFRMVGRDLYFKDRPPGFLPRGAISWMCTVYVTDDSELHSKPDGLILVWTLEMLTKIISLSTLVCAGACIPANVGAGGGLSGLELLTAGNIPDGSNLLLLHAACLLFCSFVTVYYVRETVDKFALWRENYLKKKLKSNYFILFRGLGQKSRAKDSRTDETRIARELQHKRWLEDPAALAQTVDSILSNKPEVELQVRTRSRAASQPKPNHVSAVTLFRDTKHVLKLKTQIEQAEHKHERACLDWKAKCEDNPGIDDSKRPTRKVGGGCCGGRCCGGDRMDLITWLEDIRIPELKIEYDDIEITELKALTSGVIGLNTIEMAAACTAPDSPLLTELCVSEIWRAPEPEDICWPAMKNTIDSYASWIATLLVVALSVMFSFVVIFIASLANLDGINEKCGCLGFIDSMPSFISELLQTYIPVVIMIIALWLIPGILYTINSRLHLISYSKITNATLHSYYKFLFFNLFVVFLISGSVFDELDALLDDFSSIPTTLGKAIPTTATFFTVFVMTTAFVEMPLKLTMVVDVALGHIKRKFFAKTAKEAEEAMEVSPLDLATEAPVYLVVFSITLTYAVMSPIILPFSLLLYGLGYLVVKEQLLCCCTTGRACSLWEDLEYHGGGTSMNIMSNLVIFGLTIALVLNASYFTIRESWWAALVSLTPIPLITWQW
eukprot:TRINITY_DN2896_c0_g1_i5.p1 TRINITY_DN2896_c0_g1~~TRINITY_DN2896_c0_g1_i5.p1  ORF type:complete len:701 (+),score=110.38 TRINITY_DN2896_c0_g1_i5:40-2142(+)